MRSAIGLGCLAVSLALGAVQAGDAAPADAPEQVFSIPRLNDITVDGKFEDWGDRGFRVDVLTDPTGNTKEASDFLPSFKLAWNEKGLLVLVVVRDDVPLEPATKPEELWKGDSIEFFVADKRGGNSYQVVAAPGVDPKSADVRGNLSDYRKTEALKKVKLTMTIFRVKNEDGYVLEVLLPWENLGVTPADGTEIGFQIYANDTDKEDERYQAMWFPLPDAHSHSERVQRLKLSAEASRAIQATANLEAEGNKLWVKVTGTSELDGQKIRVKDGEKTVGKGKLTAQGVRATAKIEVQKKGADALGPLTVLVDDKPIAVLDAPAAEEKK